jgi:hypothetical protein
VDDSNVAPALVALLSLAVAMALVFVPSLRRRLPCDYGLLFSYSAFLVAPSVWLIAFRPASPFYIAYMEHLGEALMLCIVFLLAYWWSRQRMLRLNVRPVEIDYGSSVLFVVLGCLAVSVAAKLYLLEVGRFFIQENRDTLSVAPLPGIVRAVQNTHILALILAATQFFHRHGRSPIASPAALIFATAFVYFVGIELAQGRRAGVVMPFLIVLVMAWLRGQLTARLLGTATIGAIALFVVATLGRASQSEAFNAATFGDFQDQAVLVGDLLVGRLGNPVIILTHILDHVRTATDPFNPDSVMRLGAAFLPGFLLNEDPFQMTIEFGRYLALTPDFDELTGINTGWIGEAYLYAGLPGVALFGVLFGGAATMVSRLASSGSDVGVAMSLFTITFSVNGFQMEIAFSFFTLVRACAVFLVLGLILQAIHQRLSPMNPVRQRAE